MRNPQFQLTRPLRGATLTKVFPLCLPPHFNSHAPCGARQMSQRVATDLLAFQLTRPLRGATCEHYADFGRVQISTHTPLAGRDPPFRGAILKTSPISTHTPLAGRDRLVCAWYYADWAFQLTRPLRGATQPLYKLVRSDVFQLTRPLRGATAQALNNATFAAFQLTRPLRGAT